MFENISVESVVASAFARLAHAPDVRRGKRIIAAYCPATGEIEAPLLGRFVRTRANGDTETIVTALMTPAQVTAFFEGNSERYHACGAMLIALDAVGGKIVKHNYALLYTAVAEANAGRRFTVSSTGQAAVEAQQQAIESADAKSRRLAVLRKYAKTEYWKIDAVDIVSDTFKSEDEARYVTDEILRLRKTDEGKEIVRCINKANNLSAEEISARVAEIQAKHSRLRREKGGKSTLTAIAPMAPVPAGQISSTTITENEEAK